MLITVLAMEEKQSTQRGTFSPSDRLHQRQASPREVIANLIYYRRVLSVSLYFWLSYFSLY